MRACSAAAVLAVRWPVLRPFPWGLDVQQAPCFLTLTRPRLRTLAHFGRELYDLHSDRSKPQVPAIRDERPELSAP